MQIALFWNYEAILIKTDATIIKLIKIETYPPANLILKTDSLDLLQIILNLSRSNWASEKSLYTLRLKCLPEDN